MTYKEFFTRIIGFAEEWLEDELDEMADNYIDLIRKYIVRVKYYPSNQDQTGTYEYKEKVEVKTFPEIDPGQLKFTDTSEDIKNKKKLKGE